MIKLLLCLVFSTATFAYCQEVNKDIPGQYEYDPVLKMKVYSMTDEMPYGPDDFERLAKMEIAIPEDDQVVGSVSLSFVVDTKGVMRDIRIYKKSAREYIQFEKNTIDALRKMRTWRVGKCKGKVVAVRVIVPMHINWQI